MDLTSSNMLYAGGASPSTSLSSTAAIPRTRFVSGFHTSKDHRTRLLDKIASERQSIASSHTTNGTNAHDPTSPAPLSPPSSPSPYSYPPDLPSQKSSTSTRGDLERGEASGGDSSSHDAFGAMRGQSMRPVSIGTAADDVSTYTEARKDRLHPHHQGPYSGTPSLTEDSSANDEIERRLRAQAQLRIRLVAARRAANAKAGDVTAGHDPQRRSSIDSGRAEDEETRSTRESRLREALLARNRTWVDNT